MHLCVCLFTTKLGPSSTQTNKMPTFTLPVESYEGQDGSLLLKRLELQALCHAAHTLYAGYFYVDLTQAKGIREEEVSIRQCLCRIGL